MNVEEYRLGSSEACRETVINSAGMGPHDMLILAPVDDIVVEPVKKLEALAKEVNELHGRAVERTREALLYARDAGEKLLAAKALVPHGEWQQWIDDHCHCAHRTAQKYMRIAGGWEELQAKAPFAALLGVTIDGAVRLLSPVCESVLPSVNTADTADTDTTDVADSDTADSDVADSDTDTGDTDDTDVADTTDDTDVADTTDDTDSADTDSADTDSADMGTTDTEGTKVTERKRVVHSDKDWVGLSAVGYLRFEFRGDNTGPALTAENVRSASASRAWIYETQSRREQKRRIARAKKNYDFAVAEGKRIIVTAFWFCVAMQIIKKVGRDEYRWVGGTISGE